MKMKIALAAIACGASLFVLPPSSASGAPLSGIGQSHGATMLDNPLLQKVHRWWRRGWGWGPYYGMATGTAMAMGTATLIIGLTILLTGRTITVATMLRLRSTIIIGRIGRPTTRGGRGSG